MFLGVTATFAPSAAAAEGTSTGRIDFDAANLPPATVELELNADMFDMMFGLGDAAIAGVAEAFAQSDQGGQGAELATQQLAATRELINLVKDVVDEVRVRVYEGADNDDSNAEFGSQFDVQLRAGNWQTVVRVHDKKDSVQVSLLEEDGAVRGVFIVASDGKDAVLVNAIGDISPENVKKLTTMATEIGLQNGLGQVIEAKMRELKSSHTHPSGQNHPENGR
jgi:hypothetical protein